MPTTRAANNAADGTPSVARGTVTPTVTAINVNHRITKTSMTLAVLPRKMGDSPMLLRYNLVMGVYAPAAATELREAMMALPRQLRRHRRDHGLTLSQLDLLGEVSRTGVSTPAQVAARMHVRVQSLTDSINELVARGLVTRRPDTADRRRQLVEVTPAGVELLGRDRAERDAWLQSAMRDNLSDLEFDLLMLVAPILRKLAKGQG